MVQVIEGVLFVAESIPQEAQYLFDQPNFAHVVTLFADGSPQTTPVWIERDGDMLLINTSRGRAKANNLERDPRIAVSVHDPANPYTYVQIRGTVELDDEGAVDHINRLSQKYLGTDYPYLQEGEQRVTVRITPERVQFAQQG